MAKKTLPPQKQNVQPGKTAPMQPPPDDHMHSYQPAGLFEGKVALVTGGDSGIGRATAIAFAKEGADVAIVYLSEDEDAEVTRRAVEAEGRRCVLVRGDIGKESFAQKVVSTVLKQLGKIDVLINNAGEQHTQEKLENITEAQLLRTFRTNFFGLFFLTKAVLPHMKKGSAIVNNASVTAYKGHEALLDYSATKGAILAFTRSLSQNLAGKGIRVNAVAPGPIWTPLIPASFSKKEVAEFGASTPMGRPGQLDEVAPAFVFLASNNASYITGQVIHPNGGTMVNG